MSRFGLSERTAIEAGIYRRASFSQIAKKIGSTARSVSAEIRRNRTLSISIGCILRRSVAAGAVMSGHLAPQWPGKFSCLLARQCRNEMEQRDYEVEAITSAETAVTSAYFTVNRKNLKGELGLSKREPYFDMILQVCDKHASLTRSAISMRCTPAINSISPYRWRRRTTRVFSFMAFFLTLRRGSRSRGGLQRP